MVPAARSASRPVYLKLRDIVAAAILDGTFAEGELLPSVRAFAARHAANPLTVAKAYHRFQLDGLVEVQRGVGMRVVPGAAARLRDIERQEFIAREWPVIVARMQALGIAPADLLSGA